MKKIIVVILLLSGFIATGQPNKKPATQPTGQPDMNKMLEEAMKAEGMSKEEQEEMKKMMKDVMPALSKVNAKTADYREFKNNRELVPRKDPARIAAMSKKALLKTEVAGFANGLYNKMLLKGIPAEMALVKKIIAQTPKAADLSSAAFLAMLQGHPQVALALSIKAVASDPNNLNWQNNMAAMLSSYGFPEQSMPLLRKLKNDLPKNSTVLNNLGQAWLGLGDLDSAKKYFSSALRMNPKHPDARNGQGLMDEMNGNREAAQKNYQKAMQQSMNPVTNQLITNSDDKQEKPPLDLEKLKQAIPYFEYFKKDWLGPLPVLSNNVYNHVEDNATLKAYSRLNKNLEDQVNKIIDKLDDDLDQTQKKGEDEFIRIMTEETMKGLNMMSKPALIIIGQLGLYMSQWQDRSSKEFLQLEKWKATLVQKRDAELDAIYKKISDSKGTTCKQFKAQLDTIENQYLRTYNHRIRSFMMQKSEELRDWFNMYCSWNWYIAGNIKNLILMQDYGFVGILVNYTTGAVTSLETRSEHCNPRTDEFTKNVPAPEMPNFDCRPVMSIPAGPEWEELLAGIKDFDNNPYGIKKTEEPVPNVDAAYGLADLLAEPAIAPFVNSADGSVSPANYVNPDDMEPSYYADEKYVPADPDTKPVPEQDTWGKERRTSRMVRELLGNMIQSDCRALKTSKEALREALARKKEAMREKIYNQMEHLHKYERLGNEIREQRIKELVAEGKRAIEKFINDNNMDNYYDNLDRVINNMAALDQFDSPRANWELEQATRLVNNTQQEVWEAKNGNQVLNSIEQHGIQVSISNGMQVPGTFNLPKNLFQ